VALSFVQRLQRAIRPSRFETSMNEKVPGRSRFSSSGQAAVGELAQSRDRAPAIDRGALARVANDFRALEGRRHRTASEAAALLAGARLARRSRNRGLAITTITRGVFNTERPIWSAARRRPASI